MQDTSSAVLSSAFNHLSESSTLINGPALGTSPFGNMPLGCAHSSFSPIRDTKQVPNHTNWDSSRYQPIKTLNFQISTKSKWLFFFKNPKPTIQTDPISLKLLILQMLWLQFKILKKTLKNSKGPDFMPQTQKMILKNIPRIYIGLYVYIKDRSLWSYHPRKRVTNKPTQESI